MADEQAGQQGTLRTPHERLAGRSGKYRNVSGCFDNRAQ